MLKAAAGTVAPENVLAPYIAPSTPHEGDTVEVFTGAWIGSSAFTYVWKNAGVAIATPAETGKTYEIRAGDAGDNITCTVTATNSIGSTPVTTAAIVPVP